MTSCKFVFVLACLIASVSHALIEKRIDERKPIEVVLSRSSHNRICVEGGSIEKVIGNSSIFSITLDASTGNAFVNLLQDVEKTPTTLTVITSFGLVQDFTVLSKNGPAEQILLKEMEEVEEEPMLSELSHASTIEMLNQIFEGKVPFGYGQVAVELGHKLEVPKPLKAHPLKAFLGPFETIVVYDIQNFGKQSIVITSETLKKEGNAWVFLNAHELKPNERALCVIGNQKGMGF